VNTSQLFKKVTPIILEVTPNSLIKGIGKLYAIDELLIMDYNTYNVLSLTGKENFCTK
jgi:hypothetical protein